MYIGPRRIIFHVHAGDTEISDRFSSRPFPFLFLLPLLPWQLPILHKHALHNYNPPSLSSHCSQTLSIHPKMGKPVMGLLLWQGVYYAVWLRPTYYMVKNGLKF